MTEREKKEICKAYADLIVKKEIYYRDWETEIAIKRLENILIRNKILIPTEAEETSETDQENSYQSRNNRTIQMVIS